MTPLQSFNVVDRLTKALSILDQLSRANEEHNSYMLWVEEHKSLRQLIFFALDTVKHIEHSE